MASFTGPDPNRLLPGEPWSSDLALASFEDAVAIAEGAAGAPRLYLRSLEQLEAGDQIRSRRDGVLTINASETADRLSVDLAQSGTIRATIRQNSGNGSVLIVRLRNDIEVTLASTTSNTTITADVSVIPGDTLILRGVAGGSSINVANARFSTDGQDLWKFSGPLEGNRAAT